MFNWYFVRFLSSDLPCHELLAIFWFSWPICKISSPQIRGKRSLVDSRLAAMTVSQLPRVTRTHWKAYIAYLLSYTDMMAIMNFWGQNLPPTLYFLFLFTPLRNNCEAENSYMEIRAEIAYKSHLSSFPQTVVDLWYTLMPHCYGHTILVIWNHIDTPSGTTYRL